MVNFKTFYLFACTVGRAKAHARHVSHGGGHRSTLGTCSLLPPCGIGIDGRVIVPAGKCPPGSYVIDFMLGVVIIAFLMYCLKSRDACRLLCFLWELREDGS